MNLNTISLNANSSTRHHRFHHRQRLDGLRRGGNGTVQAVPGK